MRVVLSFVLVLVGMVVLLAVLVNWWEPDDRPQRLETIRLGLAGAIRDAVRPGAHRHR